jgi:hypothetical protein
MATLRIGACSSKHPSWAGLLDHGVDVFLNVNSRCEGCAPLTIETIGGMPGGAGGRG